MDNTSMSASLWTQPTLICPSFLSSPSFVPSLLLISGIICEAPWYRPDTYSLRAGWNPGLICISEGGRGGLGAGSSTGWAWESASGNGKIFFFNSVLGKTQSTLCPTFWALRHLEQNVIRELLTHFPHLRGSSEGSFSAKKSMNFALYDKENSSTETISPKRARHRIHIFEGSGRSSIDSDPHKAVLCLTIEAL